jgi:glycine C-acetyltransferase/8-amino-7-oxononanoate synthase
MRDELAREGFEVAGSSTQIVPLVVGDADLAMRVCEIAIEGGVFAQAIRPPTVPAGTSRLRLVATAAHDPADLQRAATVLYENVMNDARYSEGRREVVPTGGVRQHGL